MIKSKLAHNLFIDKYNERIRFSSPVSGSVTEIVRGAKRRIMEVKIAADSEISYESFSCDINSSRDKIIEGLLESGVWPFIRQKPFDIIANPSDNPKGNIYFNI